jgi:hypothetical protein
VNRIISNVVMTRSVVAGESAWVMKCAVDSTIVHDDCQTNLDPSSRLK